MLSVCLCEDNKKTLTHYTSMVKAIASKNDLDVDVITFSSGESLIFYLSENLDKADIIYLDILLGKMTGIDVAEELRSLGCEAEIIFLTSSKEFVFDAFDFSPIQYLIKSDTDLDKFEEVFLRAAKISLEKESSTFVCGTGSSKIVIPFKDISFFEIRKRVISANLKDQTHEFYSSMDDLIQKLPDKYFCRMHRSYVVNLAYISRFNKDSLLLKTGITIPVGLTYKNNLQKAFSDYYAMSDS